MKKILIAILVVLLLFISAKTILAVKFDRQEAIQVTEAAPLKTRNSGTSRKRGTEYSR